jgi:transcriptional regulator with XRE-family HTH domain
MFTDRLKQLLKEKNITKKQFCDDIQINKNLPKYWEDNNTCPNRTILNSIANYFNVSVEYLKGETDIREKEKTPTNVGEGEQELFELWSNVPAEKREAFIKLFKALLETL